MKGISTIDKDKFEKTCQICLKSQEGACVKCNYDSCERYFHVECARRRKYFMELLSLSKSTIYCRYHEPLEIVKTMEEKKNEKREELLKFCRSIEKYIGKNKTVKAPEKLPRFGMKRKWETRKKKNYE